MTTATFTNRKTNETYTLKNVQDLSQAWNLATFVCKRMGWNFDMFCNDVKVKIS
jgi:uncharacterized protein YjaG (DUF416 family)